MNEVTIISALEQQIEIQNNLIKRLEGRIQYLEQIESLVFPSDDEGKIIPIRKLSFVPFIKNNGNER